MESERNLMNTTEAARYLGVKPSYLYKRNQVISTRRRHAPLSGPRRRPSWIFSDNVPLTRPIPSV